MKRLYYKLLLVIVVVFSLFSCKKFVDINDNPNSITGTIAEEFLLPKAIVNWANFQPYASNYGEQQVGYIANAGGVSGWGTLVSYNYGPGDYSGWWNLYDNITDLNAIIDRSSEDATYVYYGAAAKILKAIHYQALVDAYNNVPFTEANKGLEDLTPAYDNGPDIYKALGDMLDEAINDFRTENSLALTLDKVKDPLFGGDKKKWRQFANTIKLRLLIRAGNKVNFTNRTFSSDGFLTEDAMVQPGYTKVAGKLNPTWARTYDASDAAVQGGLQQRVPTYYILGFYDGAKISDQYRMNLVYRLVRYSLPGRNQLGFDPGEATSAKVNPPNDWFQSFAAAPKATDYAAIGIFKGPSAAQPIMLASESYFLQSEGVVKGLISGNAKTLFENGILESFRYLNKNESGTTSTLYSTPEGGWIWNQNGDAEAGTGLEAIDPKKEFEFYLTEGNNASNYLVNFDLATTPEQKLESIITQKYIAFNMLFGAESWNEYRRTGYPRTTSPSVANRVTSFVSLQSASTAPDKLPTRIQYPQAEFTYNASNVNQQKGSGPNGGINVFQDKIFWAK